MKYLANFLTVLEGLFLWRGVEKHLHVSMVTDSSLYKWRALVYSNDNPTEFFLISGMEKDERAIHLKEHKLWLMVLDQFQISFKVIYWMLTLT